MVRQWAGVLALAVAATAGAQAVRTQQYGGGYTYGRSGYPYGQRTSAELTIEQQRKLGLSAEQIRKIAELRRDLEKERDALGKQLEAARAAASAANAEVARLNGRIGEITRVRIRKVFESVMSPEQVKAWKKQDYAEQAKQYLRGYMRWLKLTDDQMEDIAQLLVPVYEKYDKMQNSLTDARERLAELRKADPVDIAAIEKAEQEVAKLSKVNVYQERYKELREAIRPGLMPDQLEKFDRTGRR